MQPMRPKALAWLSRSSASEAAAAEPNSAACRWASGGPAPGSRLAPGWLGDLLRTACDFRLLLFPYVYLMIYIYIRKKERDIHKYI